MQHTTGVGVAAAQLADTDRRALSQAWYSALHLAERSRTAAPATRARQPAAALPHERCPASRALGAPQRCAGDVARRAERTTVVRQPGGDAERRAPKTDRERRIERGLRRPVARGVTAAFTVRGAGGRVQLIVRGDGARTRIVAVCAPPLRERVERALAHARFAIAGHGLRAEVA